MHSLKTLAVSATFLAQSALAAASNNVALYWGQNGYGGQQSLAHYCESSSEDYVVVSFLNSFPDPTDINLSNMCGNTFPDGTLHCSNVAADIKTCQAAGKKIILSLGGAIGNYGFSSVTDAEDFATTLWNKFGGGSDAQRPFDDAVVDGFDFDIELGSSVGYAQLATKLRTLFAKDSSKTYTLSASPQCVYPDGHMGELLSDSYLDFAFVQFYNNACSVDKSFNLATWLQFAKTAPNPNMKIYVGVPSFPLAADYVNAATLKSKIAEFACDPNFGGVSLWDASGEEYYVANSETVFSVQVRELLESIQCAVSSSAPATSSVATVPTYQSYANSTVAGGVVTETDIHTTVVTITSCSENKCHHVPVTTGYVVVTSMNTVYTTYCPLTSSVPAVTVPVVSTPAVPAPVSSGPATTTIAPASSGPAPVTSGPATTTIASVPEVPAKHVVQSETTTEITTEVTLTITRSSETECTTCGAPTPVLSTPAVVSYSNGTNPVVSTYVGAGSTVSNMGYLAVAFALIGFF
jgi:chitinase